MEDFYVLIRKWYVPSKHTRMFPPKFEEILKLGRSTDLNLVLAERSRLCIYAFVESQKRDQEFSDRIDPIARIRDISTFISPISSVKRVDEYTRSPMKMELYLSPGESRGYWKYHTFNKGT